MKLITKIECLDYSYGIITLRITQSNECDGSIIFEDRIKRLCVWDSITLTTIESEEPIRYRTIYDDPHLTNPDKRQEDRRHNILKVGRRESDRRR